MKKKEGREKWKSEREREKCDTLLFSANKTSCESDGSPVN